MGKWTTPLQCLAVLASFAAAAAVYPFAPEKVPIHWGLNGQPNNFAGKLEGLFLLPLVTLGMFGLLKVAPRLDLQRARRPEFAEAHGVVSLAILVYLDCIQLIALLWALGVRFNVTLAVLPPLLLLIGVMTSVYGRLRRASRRA